MIPNIIHFIFGLDKEFGGKGFSFIHFLAVYTAWKINKPEKVYFHYVHEPAGQWWERVRPYLTLKKITAPEEIFGNPIQDYAHKSDVLRLEILQKYGGIYLDIDNICINSFAPLLQHNFVMGIEPGIGLCNAVVLSESGAEFLSLWYEKYRDFDGKEWNYHSVKLPYLLSKTYPSLIHVEGPYSFFYPLYSDPVYHYLWLSSAPLGLRAKSIFATLQRIIVHHVKRKQGPRGYKFHGIHGREWHFRKLCQSYCVHLWQNIWWERFLRGLTPEVLANDSCNFCRLIRKILTQQEILTLQ